MNAKLKYGTSLLILATLLFSSLFSFGFSIYQSTLQQHSAGELTPTISRHCQPTDHDNMPVAFLTLAEVELEEQVVTKPLFPILSSFSSRSDCDFCIAFTLSTNHSQVSYSYAQAPFYIWCSTLKIPS